MKFFVAFACLLVVIDAVSDQDLWIEFKNDHGKTYKNLREERLRFNIFRRNLNEIELHNAKYEKGEVTYFMKVNQFSDLTRGEFVDMLNKNFKSKPNLQTFPIEEEENDQLAAPDSINWVEKGAVTVVKDQKTCGSCWAFGIIGSIEGQNFIKHKRRDSLSVQQLVDCSTKNFGCSGGYLKQGFDYVVKKTIATESDYPYEADDGKCQNITSSVKVRGYKTVAPNEDALRRAVGTIGPVTVGINAVYLSSYGGGIFYNPQCTDVLLNHAVLVVGYGTENGIYYWLVKNSWGKGWGENGFFRLARNKDNQCGIADQCYYPKM